MITLEVEDVKFSLPLGDRYVLTVRCEMDSGSDNRDIDGYELMDVWNVSKERVGSLEELSLLAEFRDEIGNAIDWDAVFYDQYLYDDTEYQDCND